VSPSDDDESEWWLNVEPQTIQVALTLAQATWWVDSEGTPYWVDAMTSRHRLAVIDYLVMKAPDLLVSVQETQIRARPGAAPHRASCELLVEGPTLADAATWLESTPLMRRLRSLPQTAP
jgi:hypothetical protein